MYPEILLVEAKHSCSCPWIKREHSPMLCLPGYEKLILDHAKRMPDDDTDSV